MSLLRKLPQQIEQFKSFNRDGLTGGECERKTLLVVGVGNVGYEVVRIGKGLDMEVLGVDVVKKHSSVSYVSIEEGPPASGYYSMRNEFNAG
jgi:Phosphoglycerate dehydrogenase and related dehydrogenases